MPAAVTSALATVAQFITAAVRPGVDVEPAKFAVAKLVASINSLVA
ncbi:MAG: hypothetical protein ACRDHE_15700 [Ktedonobacterales bacterium]